MATKKIKNTAGLTYGSQNTNRQSATEEERLKKLQENYKQYRQEVSSGAAQKKVEDAYNRVKAYQTTQDQAVSAYNKRFANGQFTNARDYTTFMNRFGTVLKSDEAYKNYLKDLDTLQDYGAISGKDEMTAIRGAVDLRNADVTGSVKRLAQAYGPYKDYDDYIARADTDEAKTARKTKYQTNKARYAELEDIINNQYGYDRNGNNRYNPLIATKEGRQKYIDLLAEKNSLEAEILSYERGSKFVSDSYDELKNNADFGTLSKKRDLNKGYRENKVAENMLDASMYTTDMNGNTYDVYGNLVTEERRNALIRQNQIQDRLGMYLNASEEEKQKAASNEDRISGTKDEVINEGIIKFWNELKEDEIDNYYYLFNKMGKAEADKYLDSLEVELGRRNNDTMAAKIAEEQGLGQLWLTVKSVLGNVVGGAMAGVDVLAKSVTGEEYNPYSIWQVPQLYGANIRDFQANALNDATGNGTFLGMNLGEVYQSVMSYVDSLAGGFAMGEGYGSTMGLGAMASKARDLYEQGATRDQIFFGSLLTGVAEEIFETWSLERLMAMKDTRSFRTIVTNMVKGLVGEGSEEGFTEIADNIIDMVVRGRNSDAIQRYYAYKDQGMTDGEATLNAFKDVGIDVYKAFVGGAIAGGLGAGARSLGQYGAYRAGRTMEGINDVSTGNYQNVIDQATTMSSGNPDIMRRLNVAQERLAQYNEQQSRRNLARAGAQVGLLNQTIETQRNRENVADIENTLKERGVKGNIRSIASAINDYLMNPSNTEYQKIINRNDTVREVYENYRDGKITSVQQRNRQYSDASTGIIRNAEGDIDVDATIERNQFNTGTTIADRAGLKAQTFDVDVNGVQTQATVDHVDEDGLYLKTTAGDTVLASDVQTDDTTRLLLDNAEAFGPQGIKAYLNGYAGSDMSVTSYTSKFEQMVRRAQNGMLMQDAVQMGVDSGLRESVAEAAYYVGVNLESYRTQSLSEEVQQNIIEAAEGVPVVSDMQATNEAVHASDDPLKLETPVVKDNASYYVDTEQMSEEDRDQMEMVAMYLDSIHRKVDFVPKIPVIDPKTGLEIHRSGANAQFSEANNGYTVNTNMMGKAFLPIVMHETIHDIAKNAPAEYKIFRDEIIKYIGEDRIKEEQQKLENMGLSVASQEVEIIANSAASILDDDQTLIEFSKRFIDDKEKRNAFINLLNKLREKILEVWHYVRNKVGWTHNQQLDYLESRAEALSAIRKAYFDGLEMIKDKAIREEEQAVNQLRAEGIMLDRESNTFVPTDKFFSIATMDDSAAGIREYVNQLVKSGVPKDIAATWIRTQIRAKRFVEENDKYLNFKADARYTVFKSNSEYPQGSVDFNNNCPRREAVTQMFDRLQRQYPNRKFTRVDMENIRQVLKNAGVPVTCGICFVEDRRQRIGETAEQFINQVKSGKLAPKFKATIGEDRYIPNFYDLTTYDGATDLYYNHPSVYQAFIQFNGAKGQAAVRLIEGMAEYRNQIMQWNRSTIESKNDRGGLRMFSVSDANPRVLLDLIQIITDSAAKGLMIQGYTKKPWFAAIAQNTGVRLLLSNIPAGQGWETVNGKDVLKYDLRDGINQSDKWYKRITNWRYIGRNIIGINEKQIRLAMSDPNIDQIIPFHSSQAKSLLKQKNLDGWYNYKYTQTPKYLTKGGDVAEAGRLYKERCLLEEQRYFAEREYGKKSPEYKEANKKYSALNRRLKNEFGVKAGTAINIYTDVIEKYNTRNKREFVESYLKECEERQYIPVFAQFLNTDENGKYIYTEGYHKFLVDYKLFDEQGNIIPQSAVFADFNDDLINEVLTDYVKVQKMADEASGGKLYDEKTFDEVEKKVIQNMDVDLSNVTSTEPLPNSSYYSIDPDELNAEYMEAVNNGWYGTAQDMVTAAAERSGLHTVHMFHGSLNNSFTVFDKAKANTEGNSGAGFYFTTNLDDAEQNYAMASGADNFFKISALADMLEEDGEWDGVEIEDRNHALQLAEEILNRNPEVKDVFLQYDNPYVRDFRNSTNLYYDIMDDFDESIVDREDYDSDEDYEEDLYRYRDEHYYEAIDSAVRGAYSDMENIYEVVDGPVADDIISKLIDETYGYDSLTWSDIHKAIDAVGDITVFKNDEAKPEWASAEMTRAIIENLGYDAIIDREVSQKFGQLNRNGLEAEHIIVFKPNQIKLADTVTYDDNGDVIPLTERFDMSNNDVRYSLVVDDDTKAAYWTEDRIDDLISRYGASDPKYSQAYAVMMDPRDFLALTVSDQTLDSWRDVNRPLDVDELTANNQTPFLQIYSKDGNMVQGHEGRHRMLALAEAGVKSVAVVIIDTDTKYSKKNLKTLTVSSQDFGKGPVNDNFEKKLKNLIPIKSSNRAKLIKQFGGDAQMTELSRQYGGNTQIRYSIDVDSLENELSKEQQEYFAESKVRDDNGRLLVVYHGTPNGGFTVFDRDRLGETTEARDSGLGFHFTDNREFALTYSNDIEGENGQLYENYLNITKPFSIFERYGISEEQLADDLVYAVTGEEDISDVNDYYDDNMDFLLAVQSNFDGELAEVKDMLAAEDARNRLIERGYDGVILPLQNTDVAMLREQGKYPGGNEYIVFDSNQIKNTDNKNPTSDPDIRYSIDQDNIDLSSVNDSNDNNLDNFRRTLDTQYRLTIAKKLTPEVADKLAGKLIRSESSEYDRKTLADALTRLINNAADKGKDLDIDEFMRKGTAIVREALLQSKEFDAERYNQDDALRKYLNQTKIKLTSTQEGEAKYLYGSIKALNQSLFGSVVHINNTTGTSLDVLWNELSQMNPVLFPADTNEGDMVEYLERAAKYLKRSSYYTNVYTGMDADGAAAIAFGELIGEYTQNDKILQVVRQMKQYARDFNADVIKEANRITKERAATQKQIVEDKKESLAKYRDTVRQGLQVYDEEIINYNNQQEQLMQEIRRMQPGDERFDAEQNLRALRDTIRQTEEERRQYEAETRQRAIQMAQYIEDATKDYLKAGGKGYTYAMDVRQAKLNMMNKATLREQKEQSQKRTVINTIRRNANNLMSRLLTSSDTKHVPENLRLVVAQFLNELDLGFRGPETRMSIEWLNRLHLLAKKMQDHNAANGTFVIDDMIIEQLVDIADDLNTRLMSVGRSVDQMSLRELQQLSDTVSLINAAIYNSDRLLSDSRKQRASALAERSITEMGTKKQRKYTKGILKMLGDFFAVDQLDSFSFAERLGNDFNNTIFKNLRKGFDKKVRYVQQGNEAFSKALRQLSADERTAKRILKTLSGAKAITNTFDLEDGQTITLTPAQVMSLYLLNKRPDARRHIYNGGLTVEEYNGVKKQEMIQVNEDEVKRIIDTLTPEQRAFADSLQKFAASSVAEWGNDVSLTLWGIKKFTDKDYWKIKVDSNTLNAVAADKKLSENVGMYSLKNLGSSKQINPQATNPLIIDDIVDGFVDHVDEMSSYGAYTVPLDDAMKWYNYRNGNRTTQRAIENYMGVAGKEYFTDFIKALNSSQSNAGAMPIADKLIANAKVAAISANARVVIQQPSAYARAADMIAPKYLLAVNPLQVVQAADRARKYSSIALWKGWGYRDVMVGKSLRDNMVGDSSLLQKINDVGGYLAGKADDITWGALWLAVEAEVKDKNPSLKAGTNEFYEAVADRFSDVIDRTQVVDSPFHRSKAMRSKNALWKMYTSFMSEPTKSYNMFVRAFSDIHQNGLKGQTAKRLARTAIAFTAATVLNSILASAVDMLRDNDDEKDLWEKYLNANAENIIDGLNPLNLIPVGKELMSIIDGYSPSRMDLDAVNDLIQVGKRAFTLISGENKQANPIRIVYDGLGALSKVVGIPIGNALRAVDSIGRLVGIDILPKNKAWASSKQTAGNIYKEYAKKGVFTSELVDKYVRLKTDEIEAEELERIKAGESRVYMSPEDVERYATNQVYNDFAKLLAENDDTIRQAYEAKIQGNSSVVSKIKKTFTAAGVPGEVFDKAVLTYANSVKESDPKSVNELDARLYSNDDLVAAIVNGYDADDIYQEIVADSNAQNPEKSVQDDTLRELYQYYQQYILEGNTAKAEDLKETTQDVFDLEESRFSNWNSNVEIMRFQQEVPEADEITATAIKDYNEHCAAYGIDKRTYYDAFVFKEHTGGEVGANGKSIPYSKCVKIMAYIDGLPLTPEQKTALASCWYQGTTLEKYKLW